MTIINVRKSPILDLIETLKSFKEYPWSITCAACDQPITKLHCEAGETPAKLEGKPIHTDCFYRLKDLKGVTPPRRS